MRRRGKVDGNHAAVVSELRGLGFSVVSLADIGGGVPDLLVGAGAHNFLFELKDPAQPPSKRVLTPDQRTFFAEWKGQVRKVTTTEEIVEVVTESYGWTQYPSE